MFKSLLKVRFLSLWQSFAGRRVKKSTGKLKILLFVLLAIYVVAALFATVGMLFMNLAKPLVSVELGWLVMAVAGLMSIAVCFVGSIFMTQQQIYEARDNELLLSMPIPPSYILASRVSMVLILNMLLGGFVLVPAFVVYCLQSSAVSALMIISFIVAFVFIAFISTAISCAGGWLVALISSKMRRKNLISVLLMLALFFGYMYLSMNLQSYTARLVEAGSEIADAISRGLPPVYLFGRAIDGPDILALLQFALWCLLPFALVYYLLSRSFIKIATSKRGTVRIVYREKELKVSSARAALLRKELGRFFSLPMYVLNSGLGAVMALIGAVVLLVKGSDLRALLGAVPGFQSIVPLLACAALCFLATTNYITAPSISLEAKTLWLLKSMPLRASEVFVAKIGASLVITLPPLAIAALVAGLVLGVTPVQGLLIIVTPLILQVFVSLMGLVLNLQFPRFDWLSETVAIKQSTSVGIAIFGGMAIVALPALVYIFLANSIPAAIYMALCALLFLVLSLIMIAFLRGKGAKIFNNL